MNQTIHTPHTIAQTASIDQGLRASLTCLVIGLSLVFLAGFAPMAELHNAAHDTRHAAAFPCH